MKFSFFSVILAFGLSIGFFGCSEKEEVTPELPAPKAKPVEEAPVKDDDPELQPMVAPAKAVPQAEEKQVPTKEESKEKAAQSVSSVVPAEEGEYVIQVGIQPSKKSAETLIQKLQEKGIQAYSSAVENPGELEGTYYRVRVGYFKSIQDANDFGKNKLEPNGFPWWVDNRSNDAVGNPSGSESLYEDYGSANNLEESEERVSATVAEPASAEENVPMEEAEGPIPDASMEETETAEVSEGVPAPAAPAVESEGETW